MTSIASGTVKPGMKTSWRYSSVISAGLKLAENFRWRKAASNKETPGPYGRLSNGFAGMVPSCGRRYDGKGQRELK